MEGEMRNVTIERRAWGTARFALALFATNLKSALALRGAFAMQAVFMLLNNVVFFVFWWVLLARVPQIRGWRLDDMEVLFGLTAVSFGLVVALAGGVRHLGECIEEGQLDTLLTQPKPTLLYAVGMRSRASGFGDVASGAAFLALSGHLSWSHAPAIILAIAAGAATIFASGVAFFSLSFWFARSETVARYLWELLITFSLYPEPLFGGALRLLLFTLLPAAFVAYLPVRLVTHPSLSAAALAAGGATAYLVAALWIFSRGVRRYASGSRFVTFG
jgi:ABC-2 type transport system permease protein